MLEKIKSLYITKNILIFLNEKRKLKVIKYSKILKNKLDIQLINYQLFSGRYIIYESNTRGKEYNGYEDTILFEGEYLNGDRNGKGKEYKNRELIFKGKYLNGKRNGKGKEYVN